MPNLSEADVQTIAVVLMALGVIVGALGYQVVVVRRRLRHLARRIDELAAGGTPRRDRRTSEPHLETSLEILSRRLAEARLLATTDLLTGVLNRQAILGRLGAEVDRAVRYRRPLAVALLDIDHFKRVNDSFGHSEGDVVLERVAGLLRANVRAVDSLGRYGGEEFLLVLPETDVDAAASLVEKLRRLVASLVVTLPAGGDVQTTLSVGVTGGAGAQLRLDRLVREADAALYAAKALGRDQVYVFSEVDDARFVGRAPIDPAARLDAVAVGRGAFQAARAWLADALVDRQPWTGKPSPMIAELAVAVARSVGLPDGEVERIRTASLLHDLGKLAVPDAILHKPAELDQVEWRAITEHPKIGQVILEQAGALRDAAAIVEHHHEWYDGRGYPHGLREEEIPVGARIVAIADAYEAMVSGRPYREAMSHAEAIAELQRYGGIQFDPQLVAVFAALFGAGVPWATSADDLAAFESQRRSDSDAGTLPKVGMTLPGGAGGAGRKAASG